MKTPFDQSSKHVPDKILPKIEPKKDYLNQRKTPTENPGNGMTWKKFNCKGGYTWISVKKKWWNK